MVNCPQAERNASPSDGFTASSLLRGSPLLFTSHKEEFDCWNN